MDRRPGIHRSRAVLCQLPSMLFGLVAVTKLLAVVNWERKENSAASFQPLAEWFSFAFGPGIQFRSQS